MGTEYRVRVCERRFLNRPGFHRGAYVLAEVQDTSDWGPHPRGKDGWENPEPVAELEIKDCSRSITLEFDWDSAAGRRNSLHKVDTLIRALERFREGLVEEQRLYVARERTIGQLERKGGARRPSVPGPHGASRP